MEVYNPAAQALAYIDDIPQDVPDYRLEDRITSAVPPYHMKMKVEGRHIYENGAVIGKEWIISFPGLREEIPQM